jgi:4'-phosphopantetheinyl transferase
MALRNLATLRLMADEIHVWWAKLDVPTDILDGLAATLSADESERAGGFVFAEDRRRFISARGILRRIIACYVDADPARLRFCYNTHGKPGLLETKTHGGLRFNVSHSGGWAVFALSIDHEIGVDIERITDDERLLEVVEAYFAPGEIASLRALPKEQQLQGFFNCWTRKEAYIKARGMGLSIPLDTFEVSLAPGAQPALLKTAEVSATHNWTLQSLNAPFGYSAALVTGGRVWRLREWGLDQCLSQQ